MGSQFKQTTLDKVSKKYRDEYGFNGYQVKISPTNYGRAAVLHFFLSLCRERFASALHLYLYAIHR